MRDHYLRGNVSSVSVVVRRRSNHSWFRLLAALLLFALLFGICLAYTARSDTPTNLWGVEIDHGILNAGELRLPYAGENRIDSSQGAERNLIAVILCGILGLTSYSYGAYLEYQKRRGSLRAFGLGSVSSLVGFFVILPSIRLSLPPEIPMKSLYFIGSGFFALIFILAYGRALWIELRKKESGLKLGAAGLLMGVFAASLFISGYSLPSEAVAVIVAKPGMGPPAVPYEVIGKIIIPSSTPEGTQSLPVYPTPTPPNLAQEEEPHETQVDFSSVVRIVIDGLDVDAEVNYIPFNGSTWDIAGLQHQVAWLGNTSWPGLGGNTVMAAHNTLRGSRNGPFRYLESLMVGDEVIVMTEENVYRYQVREQKIVEETDLTVVAQTEDAQLTLLTCADWSPTTHRYMRRRVVFADLVEVLPLAEQGIG
ncbi:MAG: sortase [Anaerolineales bacterium]|nr:sortase [Anaerolineales bacterium]